MGFCQSSGYASLSVRISSKRMVEVAGIEPDTPNGLQLYNIIRYNYTAKIVNGTGLS